MQKISSKDAASLLKQAGAAIRHLTTKNQGLEEKVASFERQGRVVQIARDMEDKGLSPDLTFQEKVAAVGQAQSLDVTEEAIKMAAPQGRILGDLSEVPGGGQHPFEHYINTGEDPVA